MRKKSPTKLQQIIDTAAKLFVERGFNMTSMAEIAAAVGGSKATLYNYFPSKNKIYIEVLMQSAHKLGGAVFDALDGDAPLYDKLSKFGADYLAFITSQPMIDIRRTFMSEVHKTGMGETVYECGMKKKWSLVSALFADEMAKGRMRQSDPWLAAMQFRALIEVDLIDRCVLGLVGQVSLDEIATAVPRALDVFDSYYRIKR